MSGGRDAAIKPPGKDSRRFPEEMTGIGQSDLGHAS